MKAWLFMSILVIFTMVCPPAFAISADDILSKYQSPTGSTSPQDFIDRVATPVAPGDGIPVSLYLHDLYPDLPEDGIGVEIDFIDDEPSGSEGRYICPPDKPVGQLHHCFCMCMEYVNMETGEKGNSECMNPETGHPYPMGIDDLGRTFIVHEDCPCAWADDDREPDSSTYHDILIPPRSRYSYDPSLFASRIQSILYPDAPYPNTPIFDSTTLR